MSQWTFKNSRFNNVAAGVLEGTLVLILEEDKGRSTSGGSAITGCASLHCRARLRKCASGQGKCLARWRRRIFSSETLKKCLSLRHGIHERCSLFQPFLEIREIRKIPSPLDFRKAKGKVAERAAQRNIGEGVDVTVAPFFIP